VDCVVVDVRDNGGGMATEFASSAGLFIDRGRVFQIKQKDGRVEKFDDKDDGISWPGPLVVLVNRRTSGGAELFAGAMQDHHRGIIVGDEATNGVAANLNVIPVAPNKQLGAVKILWALMYRPSGEGVQGKGIRSDVVLPSVTESLAKHKESDGKATIVDRLGKDGFSPAKQEVGDVARLLQKKSTARVSKEPEFQELEKLLRRLEDRLQSQSVSLKESEFDKQWNDGQRDGTSMAADPTQGPLKRNFYLDEVLNIAGDLSDEFQDN
jgi:carboxyl-terminal processing protease